MTRQTALSVGNSSPNRERPWLQRPPARPVSGVHIYDLTDRSGCSLALVGKVWGSSSTTIIR